MKVWRWLRSLFAWREVGDWSGVWLYQENTVTGERKALRISTAGWQPVDLAWLEVGNGYRIIDGTRSRRVKSSAGAGDGITDGSPRSRPVARQISPSLCGNEW